LDTYVLGMQNLKVRSNTTLSTKVMKFKISEISLTVNCMIRVVDYNGKE